MRQTCRAAILALLLVTGISFLHAEERGLSVIATETFGLTNVTIGKQYVVLIGIDKYKEWPSLKGAVSEVSAVKKVLSERYYIDEFIELYNEKATAAGIRKLFRETLPGKIGLDDSVLIFYAGHGQLDESKTGFWIAHDGTRDVDAQNGWVPNSQLRNFIADLKAQHVLVVADACFSGDFMKVERGAAPTVDNAFFRKALSLKSRQILTSGASETVPDDSEFAKGFLNFLERNNEPLVDPYSIYDRLRLGVTQTVPLIGTLPGHEQGASFVLFLKPKEKPAENKPSVAVGSGTSSGSAGPGTSTAVATQVKPETLPATSNSVNQASTGIVQSNPAIASLELMKASLMLQKTPARNSQDFKRGMGWVTLLSGLGGLAGGGVLYVQGQETYRKYKSATTNAGDLWKELQGISTLTIGSAAFGGLMLLLTPPLMLSDDVGALDRQIKDIDLQIEALRKGSN